jgi:phosphopantothenoylcysteine decarboxylase/phosphopantothenate--cysteine ligase
VLISAGATREPIDPVRFITNHSSGKMGYALARAAMHRGAEVTVVAAHTDVEPPLFVNVVPVQTAEEMYDAIVSRAQEMFEAASAAFVHADAAILTAAVADYTPAVTADNKIKKKDGDMSIPLVRTKDILKTLGENKRPGQILCGFSMETENVLENSRKKLESKHCDMICANSLKSAGAGFGTDTNIVTLITKNSEESLELMSKEQVAHKILDKLLAIVQP